MPIFRGLPDNPIWVTFNIFPEAANDDDWTPPKRYA